MRQLEEDVHRPAEDERAHEVAAGRRDRGEDRDAEDDHAARAAVSRCEVTIPTLDRPTSRIGNSITSPNARNIVVTKSKYGPAAMSGDEVIVREAEEERGRVRQDEVGDGDAEGEEEQGERDPGPDGLALRRASAPAR